MQIVSIILCNTGNTCYYSLDVIFVVGYGSRVFRDIVQMQV